MATTFTVAVPTHDRRDLVTLAVRSALAQTRPALEAIVLADGCTDGTAAALRGLGDPRVRVVELPKGPGHAYAHRNVALREARGEVVAWLGDEDLWWPDHLAIVGELWDAGGVDLVQACAVLVDERGALGATGATGADWGVERFRAKALRGADRTPLAAISHRPGPALAVGGWDDALERRADVDLWRRMLEAGAPSAMSATPTVLHPRGARRERTPAQRLAQQRALAAALAEPAARARLRSEAVRAAQRELAAREQELDEAADECMRLGQQADLFAREAERQRVVLEAIYNGAGWRLRRRVGALPLVGRLFRRRGM